MKGTIFALTWLWPLIHGSTTTSSASASWQSYVRAPSSRIVSPAKILAIQGNVSNAAALINHKGVATLSRPKTGDTVPSITLDFGLNVVGYPQVSFAGASNNQPGVRLTFSETTEYLTNVSDFTRSDNGDTITPGTDQFAVPRQPYNWTDTNGCLYNGYQVCADGLHGFRYLRIALDALDEDSPYTSPNGTVTIKAVTLNFTAFLGTPDTYTGWFECSDQNLTQYWFDAAYTNEMITDHFRAADVDPRDADSPTLEGKLVLFDGAKRDRDPYSGDIAVSGLTSYLTHNISVAARNVIADLADHQRNDGFIPPASIQDYSLLLFDYPLWWVVIGWEYILYTGDQSFATAYYPNLVAVLDQWYPSVTNSSGLLSKGLNGTSDYKDYAFLPHTGQVTYYNALYVLALRNAASWASFLQHSASSTRWTKRAASVSSAINQYLWDPTVGAYLDTTDPSTGVFHPQDGNGIAILAGVASPSRAQSALTYLSNHTAQPYGNAFYDHPVPTVDNANQRVYAFTSFFELQARFLSNQTSSALAEISRLYGWMRHHDPDSTTWEALGPNGTKYEGGYTSCAHGWSTGVVPLLSTYVLGLSPTDPGFRSWKVKPFVPESLEWAKGQVGTAFGPLEVSWAKDVGSAALQVNVSVPGGTNGTISVPILSGQDVFLDGMEEKEVKVVEGYVALGGIRAGNHTVEVR